MCLACAFPTASGDWTEAGFPAGADGARDRAQAVSILARVLARCELKLQSIAPTGGFRISTPSGRHLYARNLSEVWSAAAQLVGRPIDPLDPNFTRGLAQQNG